MIRITYDDYSAGINPSGTVVTAPLDDKKMIDKNKITLVPGKIIEPDQISLALKSGPRSTNYVEYAAKSVISPAGRTIEMWVCPLDWEPTDNRFHVFFEATGVVKLILYKSYEFDRLLMLTRDTNTTEERNRHSNIYIGNWMPGEWHHIAASSSPYSICVFNQLGKTEIATDRPAKA